MNKADIVADISITTGYEEDVVLQIVDAFLQSIVDSVSGGESVSLHGFGRFATKDRKARNYKSGILGDRVIEAPAYTAVKFTAGQTFADLVRASFNHNE